VNHREVSVKVEQRYQATRISNIEYLIVRYIMLLIHASR